MGVFNAKLFFKKKGKTPIPDSTIRRVWNSLRQRYNINPSSFKTQKQLIAFLEKKKSPAVRLAKTQAFWKKSQEKRIVTIRRKVKIPVVKTFKKRVWFKVLKTRKDGIKQHYWVKKTITAKRKSYKIVARKHHLIKPKF